MSEKIYGYELIIDLSECDLEVITSKRKLKIYVDTLCELIKMKKFGRLLLPYFGEKAQYTKGYSLVQLIETSSITGHFSDYWKKAYLNIFSCKKFDPHVAKKYTKEYFGAKRMKSRFLTR
ncbi:MAG: S-adenosylmethionine decarboxylase [Candidatus Omnitrophica bacterium]|nr:S-adenosylmethionine decarboxylase [Candidatus Omnitrophota bacterium]